MNIIEELENEQLKKDVPEFSPGDTVVVRDVTPRGGPARPESGEPERVMARAERSRGAQP